ncbi:TSC22 domain family protein 1 isoform X1 [Myxocyprinus asiaticus]|uniref:TSC22 domain family protein 1 isoform X1 n=1 Tax=Myxocyprinus asiaticus TaxID=70543 RepID=UPI002221EF49|nr:TSC22 domain family protein 1 isoform X1 [Myxocyprinus asiaticus]
MHHSNSPGETPSSRRMSHPSVFAGRRGSNPTSGATVSINCPVAPAEDHQTAGMMPHAAPTGSSSPGPHHPPHSLNIHPQGQTVGAQVKKKSGFQITSVLPAQVSASANNSIADDTESYDDMDESHTEDLSSSDILDVSVSRATDTGIPERSSSEETLNSLHGGETPGVASPNEPVLHHPQQGYMANGVHHHAPHHHHQPHGHHKEQGTRPAAATQVRPTSLASTGGVTAQSSGRSTQAAVVDGGGTAAVSHPAASTGSVLRSATEIGGGSGPTGSASVAVTVPPAQLPPPIPTTTQTQTTAAATASRFRVVKLDSNSEPFRKGRWMCAEYYEKDAPSGDTTVAAHRTVETIIQSEHETTSGSSSGSTLSGGGDVQQTYATHTALPPQDLNAHAILQPAVAPSINPHVVTQTGMMGTESSSAPVRPQQPVSYTVEGQIPQMQSSYPTNAKPALSVTQSGMPPMEYAQMPTAQPLQIPPIQTAVSPRAAPAPIGIPGLPVVPQSASSRPQVPAPQMGTVTPAQLHPEQQQPAPQQSSSTTSVPSGSNMPSSAGAQSLLHGAAILGRPAVLGQQGAQLPPSGVSYSGMSAVTASQLEDAQRLLLQHHPLLALPRLAAGGMTGQAATDAGAALGQDVSAAAVLTGADDDSSSGASVVAIDNKIEQAMDLVKSHLMYAVREEVEVLKEQIKELIERNSQLEQENTLLKNLASPEQLAQFQQEVQTASPTSGGQTGPFTQSQGPGPTA